MAGYSLKTVEEKLGLKEGSAVAILNSPLPLEKIITTPLSHFKFFTTLKEKLAFILFYTSVTADLEENFPKLKKSLNLDGVLWIAWPKGASKIPTDLNENIIRDIGLNSGLVDVKVIAIDEDWSGLKFVYRLNDRKEVKI